MFFSVLLKRGGGVVVCTCSVLAIMYVRNKNLSIVCDLTKKYSIVSSFCITLETELVHKGGESHILCHLCYLFILGLFLFFFKVGWGYGFNFKSINLF
jgi:hypothetical protein